MILLSIIENIKAEYDLVGENTELEVRLGTTVGNSVQTTVPKHIYTRVIKNLAQSEVSMIDDRIINGIRRRTQTIAGEEIIEFSRKCRIKNWPLPEYGMIVELSKEIPLIKNDPNLPKFDDPSAYNRSMIRKRYLMEGGNVAVDASVVHISNNGLISTHYEIEIELANSSALDGTSLEVVVDDIFTYAYDTRKVYALSQMYNAMNVLTSYLGQFEGSVRVSKIRNLIPEDLRFGGIIKNPYVRHASSYLVCYKPKHGRHSLLMVASDGMWIYNVNGRYLSYYMDNRELYGDEVDSKGFAVTVLDGFFINTETIRDIFYMQDVIISNSTHQAFNLISYDKRIILGNEIAKYLQDASIEVLRSKTINFNNPDEFYKATSEMIDNMDAFKPGFSISGLIFRPTSIPYFGTIVPTGSVLSLANQPAIVKWINPTEITMDLHIRWTNSGDMKLFTGDDKHFVGSITHPLLSLEAQPTDDINMGTADPGQLV